VFWPSVYIEAHNKIRYKLNGASKGLHVTQGRLFGNVAYNFQRINALSHQTCTCQCSFKQESRQVLATQHGRVAHMKENETKIMN